jgi:class 3 adenylate cyclase/tetratricopeptide (TPR) repeat protein
MPSHGGAIAAGASSEPSSVLTAAIQEESTEQRRIVTALFADITGSTALADPMDPEDVRTLLGAFFATMARAIRRHGGTTEKYIGDAVMAVFGLPVAHEDDPVRAVRAAFDMQEALRAFNAERRAVDGSAPELQMRIGINTGEVAAAGGALEGRDFLITGDPVNIAARLQQSAAPGSILVGPRTYRGTAGAVRYRALPAAALRGKSRLVRVWEAQAMLDEGAVPAQRPRGVDGLRAPLVGREVELELLGALFTRVQRERRPHLVTILGAPGVGKTRLAHEFLGQMLAAPPIVLPVRADATTEAATDSAMDAAQDTAQDTAVSPAPPHAAAIGDAAPVPQPRVLEGRCPVYGEGITYWPLAEMLRAQCGFTALERGESARAKLLTCVRDVLAAADKADDAEVLAALLGHTIGIETAGRRRALLPTDSVQLQEAMLRAWRIFFEALAAPTGLVVLIEDIHWADDLLLDLLEYVAARASGIPLLLLCSARPELLERWPDWGGGKRNYALIALEALSPAETRALLQALLPGPNIPESLRQGILRKADGNPFFVEEILHMLVDRGVLVPASLDAPDVLDVSDVPDAPGGRGGWRVAPECVGCVEIDELAIPDTVQGVLLARLDLLAPDERDVLQHAAVIGRYFWASALRRLVAHLDTPRLDDVLAALQHKDLIHTSDPDKHSVAPPGEPVYTFNHPLTREVTYSTIVRTRRAHEHARVAEMLEELALGREEELAELLALHYHQYYVQAGLARSRSVGRRQAVREKVVRYLTLAGDQAAARQAAAKATHFYTDALGILEADGERRDLGPDLPADVPRRVDLYTRRGDVRWAAVRSDEAWRDYRQALDLWSAYPATLAGGQVGKNADGGGSGDMNGLDETSEGGVKGAEGIEAVCAMMPDEWRLRGLRLYRLVVQLPARDAGLFQQPPAHEVIARYLEDGLRLTEGLGQCDTAEYAALLTAKAFFWWSWPERRGERELLDALRGAREAVRILEALGDARGASEALDALGNIQATTTDLRGYLESQRRRIGWAERINEARELVDIHAEVSLAHQLVGEYALAARHAQTALALADEADADPLRAQALRSAVLAHFEWDDWAEAERLGTGLLAVSGRAEVVRTDRHAWALLALAIVAARTGKRDEAEHLAEQAAQYVRGSDARTSQFVELFRARLALARGATREARRILLDALECRSGRQSLAALLAELAELAARTGDARLYERFGAQALELGWRSGARKALAQATRARGIVALGESRWDDALCDAESALLAFQELGATWEAARTRYVLAGIYRRRAGPGNPGDDGCAVEELSHALELFRRLHAQRDVARARAALAGGDIRLP